MTILTIAGSPAARSRSTFLLRYAARQLERKGFEVSELGLSDLPADVLVKGQYMSEEAQALRERVIHAQAVLIASPIYKASFSGGLKAVLDLLDERALADKLVLPIATGGSTAHLLALEYGFKPVLSALGARHILAGIYATDKQVTLDGNEGQIDDDVRHRLDTSADIIAEHLRRQAHHRPAEPYDFDALVAGGQVTV